LTNAIGQQKAIKVIKHKSKIAKLRATTATHMRGSISNNSGKSQESLTNTLKTRAVYHVEMHCVQRCCAVRLLFHAQVLIRTVT